MARIFISHSSANNAEVFSGQRWLDRLQASAGRCRAVRFVLSRAWLSSRYCTAEFWEARKPSQPLSLPETVCREKLHGSLVTVKDPNTGRKVERIAERLLTSDDIKAAPILAGREGEDVCASFLEPRHWWSRLAFWR